MNWKMSLNEPGMTAYHKAGLAGLTASLLWLQKQREQDPFLDDPLEGIERVEADDTSLTIYGIEPGLESLRLLLRLVYRLEDGIVTFPLAEQWSLIQRARLHQLMLTTFLQHPQAREGEKQMSEITMPLEDEEAQQASVRVLRLHRIKVYDSAAERWAKAVEKKKRVELTSMLLPGAMQRHNAVKASALTDRTEVFPALLFAPSGCLFFRGTSYLPNGEFDARTSAFVVVPSPVSLIGYSQRLTYYYERIGREDIRRVWSVAGTSDAALQAAVGLGVRPLSYYLQENRGEAAPLDTPLSVVRFGKVAWSQQTIRTGAFQAIRLPEQALQKYEWVQRQLTDEGGSGRTRLVFPFQAQLADNLVSGRPWFAGFADTMKSLRSSKMYLGWKQELRRMTGGDSAMWDERSHSRFVDLVQKALENQYGKTGSRAQEQGADARRALERDYERLRIAFTRSRTEEQFRGELMQFFSQTRPKLPDGSGVEIMKDVFRAKDWRFYRDLALMAIASYAGKEKDDSGSRAATESK